MNLFDKYGGVNTVVTLVNNFYTRVFQHPNLRRYFSDVDQTRLKNHQIQYVAYMLGKPIKNLPYDYIKNAHHRIEITGHSFDQMATIFREELMRAGVEMPDVDAVMGLIESHRKHVVTRA
jgi:truncated hemoglobin YjbI